MPRISFLLAACSCFAIGAQAQTTDSGVLLAVREGGGYHSYWITHSGTEARIAVTLPQIVVPHGSGFWRVGVTTVCEFDGVSNGNRAIVWESPLEKVATVFQRTPCVKRRDVQTCGEITALVWFVSSSLISEQYSKGQTEECEPRGGRWTTVDEVRNLGDEKWLEITAFAGSSAEESFWKALEDGFVELRQRGMNCPAPPPKEQTDLTNWSVNHVDGAWHPVADYSVGQSECEIAHPLAAVMPHSATADSTSEEALFTAKRNMPELCDMFVSPNRAWAVAVREEKNLQSLAVYEIRDGLLGRKLLDLSSGLPAGTNNVVSAQWALGAHAADWTSLLDTASKAGEIKPRVVIDPKQVRDSFQQ